MNKLQNKKFRFRVKPILCESTHQAIEDFYMYGNVKKNAFSETQKYMKKKFQCCKQIRTLHTKTEYTNKECLPVWLNLESTHTCLVASDIFVKPEDLRHVPRKSFANTCLTP